MNGIDILEESVVKYCFFFVGTDDISDALAAVADETERTKPTAHEERERGKNKTMPKAGSVARRKSDTKRTSLSGIEKLSLL